MINNQLPLVITIDGTAGSGKGTISKKLAKKLGWNFLDSGALYRALGLLYIYNNKNLGLGYLDLNDLEKVQREQSFIDQLNLDLQLIVDVEENFWLELASDLSLNVDLQEEQEEFLLHYKEKTFNLTNAIKTEFCGDIASRLAAIPKVRSALLDKQKQYLKAPGLVADGRDMGTVVFPEAEIKVFLDADPKIRASRRFMQLKEIGVGGTLHNRIDELSERDLRDSLRKIAPLKPAADAIIIDTTRMTIDEVFDMVMYRVNLIV